MRRIILLLPIVALGCSSPAAVAPQDAGFEAATPACVDGPVIRDGPSQDCVGLASSEACCPGEAAYRCADPGRFPTNAAPTAFGDGGGVICSSSDCVRARRYDKACAGSPYATKLDGGAAVSEAYSCAPDPDGGAIPLVNILGTCGPLGAEPTPGEAPVFCCP